MTRVTLTGPDLEGLRVEHAAASVRLLLPSPGARQLVMPRWTGNEFLLLDGRRPTIRTLTPRRVAGVELDLDIVVHGGGVASDWAQQTRPGDQAAVSGPGRGYTIDHNAPGFFLAGDETAIPAMSQLLEALPSVRPVQVRIEIADPDAVIKLPDHPGSTVAWHEIPPRGSPGDALVDAIRGADLTPGTRVWVAGEAAAMQRVRRHLFEERRLLRDEATVRGYWKHGRTSDADDLT